MTYGKEKARPGGQPGSPVDAGSLKNLRIFRRDPAGLCQFEQNGTETGRKTGTPLTQARAGFVRRWLGLCRLGFCGGSIDHDRHSTFWQCSTCSKIIRGAGKGSHWEPMDGRTCTCHPDDNPPRPCPRKFAFSECLAESRMTT